MWIYNGNVIEQDAQPYHKLLMQPKSLVHSEPSTKPLPEAITYNEHSHAKAFESLILLGFMVNRPYFIGPRWFFYFVSPQWFGRIWM